MNNVWLTYLGLRCERLSVSVNFAALKLRSLERFVAGMPLIMSCHVLSCENDWASRLVPSCCWFSSSRPVLGKTKTGPRSCFLTLTHICRNYCLYATVTSNVLKFKISLIVKCVLVLFITMSV